MDLRCESQRIFRIRTTNGPGGVYAITPLHLCNTFANRFDDAGGIRPGSIGKRRLYGVRTRAHISVIGIDACRMNSHQHLAR